jgi:hypothetical protein
MALVLREVRSLGQSGPHGCVRPGPEMDPKRKLSGTAYMKKILMVTARLSLI